MSNYDAYPEFVPEVNPWVVPVERTEEGTPSTTYPGELLQGEAAAAALDQYEAAGEHLTPISITLETLLPLASQHAKLFT